MLLYCYDIISISILLCMKLFIVLVLSLYFFGTMLYGLMNVPVFEYQYMIYTNVHVIAPFVITRI